MGMMANIFRGQSIDQGLAAASLKTRWEDALAVADTIDVTTDFVLYGRDLDGDGVINMVDQRIAQWLNNVQNRLFTGDIAQLLTLEGADLEKFLQTHDVNRLLTDFYAGSQLLLQGETGVDMSVVTNSRNSQLMGTLMAVQDAATIIGDKLSGVIHSDVDFAQAMQTAQTNIAAQISAIEAVSDWQKDTNLAQQHSALEDMRQRLADILAKSQRGELVASDVQSLLASCLNSDRRTLNEAGAVFFGDSVSADYSAQVSSLNNLAQSADLIVNSRATLAQVNVTYGSFDRVGQQIQSLFANMYVAYGASVSMSGIEKSNELAEIQRKADEQLSQQLAARVGIRPRPQAEREQE